MAEVMYILGVFVCAAILDDSPDARRHRIIQAIASFTWPVIAVFFVYEYLKDELWESV